MTDLTLSPLPHTWFIDVDGVIMRHNGHKDGTDELLPGAHAFWDQIPANDLIVLVTARQSEEVDALLRALNTAGLRHDRILAGLPVGERIVINDRKPSGLQTSIAVNLERDAGLAGLTVSVDPDL